MKIIIKDRNFDVLIGLKSHISLGIFSEVIKIENNCIIIEKTEYDILADGSETTIHKVYIHDSNIIRILSLFGIHIRLTKEMKYPKTPVSILKCETYDFMMEIRDKFYVKKEDKIKIDDESRIIYKNKEEIYLSTTDTFTFSEFIDHILTNPCDIYECGSFPCLYLTEKESGYMGNIVNETHLWWDREKECYIEVK